MTTNVATPPIVITADDGMQARRARQSLLVFAGFLIPLSLFGYWFYRMMGNDLPVIPSLPLMLSPGLAAILTRLLRREGFADVSFRLYGNRMRSAFLIAFGLPLVVGAIAYGFAYLSGLAKFDPPSFPVDAGSPLAQLGVILLFAATAGFLLSFPTTAGEEIGWRGYLLPRMIDARIPQPILLTSLIWGAWHLPVVFMGVYAVGPSPWISAAGIMMAALVAGYIISWLRLRTGSIWPAIAMHAAWNALINAGFTFATHNPNSNIWIGEQGILVLATLAVAALVIRRFWNPISIHQDFARS